MNSNTRPGITITRAQITVWSGHRLTDEEFERLAVAVPNSSIPEAIEEIVASILDDTRGRVRR